jgi:hypothetical protein
MVYLFVYFEIFVGVFTAKSFLEAVGLGLNWRSEVVRCWILTEGTGTYGRRSHLPNIRKVFVEIGVRCLLLLFVSWWEGRFCKPCIRFIKAESLKLLRWDSNSTFSASFWFIFRIKWEPRWISSFTPVALISPSSAETSYNPWISRPFNSYYL